MLHLGSWIRECDLENFGLFFANHPDIRVSDARVAPVDLSTIHGLLVTGGPDISAQFHREPPADLSQIIEPEPERDTWEITAVKYAYERGLPMLCICKGLQVLNVALGGTLNFDIQGHNLPEQKLGNVQPLRYDTGAAHRYELVNSSHHQSLAEVAAPLKVEAWHAGDGTIEQVRIKDYPWGVGVQYHPERDYTYYRPLFEDFFAQLKK